MKCVQVDISDPGVTQTIGSSGKPWIAREIDGTLHCTYFKWFDEAPIWRIMHGYSIDDGDTWTLEEVATLPEDSNWLNGPSICIDDIDIIFIIWERRDGTTHYLESAWYYAGEWTSEPITSWTSSSVGARASNIAVIDDLGTVHVIFRVQVSGTDSLCHIRRFSGVWDANYVVVASGTVSGTFAAATVSGDGDLHLIYRDIVNGDYKLYYNYYSIAWHSATEIVSSASLILLDDFVADSSNNLHLAYSISRSDYYKERLSGESTWEDSELIILPTLPAWSAIVLSLDTSQVVKATDWNSLSSYQERVRLFKDIGTDWVPGIQQNLSSGIMITFLSPGSSLHHLFPDDSGNYPGLTATNEAILLAEVDAESVYDLAIYFVQFVGTFPYAGSRAYIIG